MKVVLSLDEARDLLLHAVKTDAGRLYLPEPMQHGGIYVRFMIDEDTGSLEGVEFGETNENSDNEQSSAKK